MRIGLVCVEIFAWSKTLDGITGPGFPPSNPLQALGLFRRPEPDIFHSSTRRSIITFRDPRNFEGWVLEFVLPSASRAQVLGNDGHFANSNRLEDVMSGLARPSAGTAAATA